MESDTVRTVQRDASVNIVYVDVTAEFAGTVLAAKTFHQLRRSRRLPLAQGSIRAIRSAWLDDNKQVA